MQHIVSSSLIIIKHVTHTNKGVEEGMKYYIDKTNNNNIFIEDNGHL